MGGILKNNNVSGQSSIQISDSTKEFREQVLKNTKLNTQLKENHNETINSINSKPIAEVTEEERLKWNTQNLSENEVIQKNIMENLTQTIDEPKTPFQHATLPEMNEYYQDDDDESAELEEFSLSEPTFKTNELDTLSKEIEEEEEPRPKRSFAELRKAHYHHEHPPALLEKLVDEEGEWNDKGEEEPSKPKNSFAKLRNEHYKNEHVSR